MKGFLLKTVIFLLVAAQAFGQDRTVTGTITAKEDGLPLPGVSVKVKGTAMGTSTDASGKFALQVPASQNTLVFTFIGYKALEMAIPSSNSITASLEADATALSEVVVTALGESREKKSLGYAIQEVKGESLTVAKSTDVSSSLAGKIAGVQLQGSPSSTFDNANIVIRGINGLNIGNPLYVVDGTPTLQENVIMDNVESISVLKGPAATALYGNRAANGVIVITSKKGARNGNPKVDLNLSSSFEDLYILPPYQNSYAGGYSSNSAAPGSSLDAEGFYIFRFKPTTHPAEWAAFDGQRIIDYGADESWGPKMSGQMYRPYYSWYPGSDFGKLEPLTAQPDNVTDFFDTGRFLNNSIAFSGGTSDLTYRVTYANQNRTLVQPGAKRDQHQFGINGSYNINKNFTVITDLAFTTNNTIGQPQEGYRLDGLNVGMNFNQWYQRQLDINKLKDYRNPDGSLRSWNIGDPNSTGNPDLYLQPQYWDSPWFVVNENYGTAKRNRIVGNLGLTYRLNDVFSISTFARANLNNGKGDFRIASGGLQQDQYNTNQLANSEMNYEASLNFKKTFGDISLDGFVGGNVRNNKNDFLNSETRGGLAFPNYFDIAASVARPFTERQYAEKEVRSVYGKASFGYKNFFYLDGTLRNDWSSALPEDNNSYLYPSVSTSFVFSELLANSSISNFLSFGKIRAAFAQVGSDLDPYQVNIAINNGSIFDGNPSAEIGNQYRTGNILPALTKSYEVGAEFRFFNRIGLDMAYYVDNNTNQILGLDVASASGFTTAQINAGNIQRKGLEVSLTGSPVKGKNFNWDMTVNFAKATSIVKELAPGINNYIYNTQRNDFRIENQVGEPWGMMVGRMWKTDDQGRNVYTGTTGINDYTTNNNLGSIIPDFTGGIFNSLSYKGLDLAFSIDFQEGGQFYSLTKMYTEGSGLSEFTTGVNDKGIDIREFPSAGGGVHVTGVTVAGAPLDTYIPARRQFYTNYQRDTRNVILSSSYVKLREVRLGYRFPTKWLGSSPVKNVNLGAIVNNAWLISAPAKKYGIDPSELELFGREGGQLSSTRQIGLNLRVGF
jgi:TonB-linked SusC/RagA family outer membrane protein